METRLPWLLVQWIPLWGDKLQPAHQVVKWRENDLFVDILLLAKAGEFLDFLELT